MRESNKNLNRGVKIPMVIAVVGAGGKTSRIHELAKQYRMEGKKVLITTTTHMMQEKGCIVTEDKQAIIEQLNRSGYCLAGRADKDGKIRGFTSEFFLQIIQEADITLVEADGSKQLPVKVPNHTEPVIPLYCSQIEVVMGLSAIGKPLKQVAHRLSQVETLLGFSDQHILTPEDLQRIITMGYLNPLRKQYPNMLVLVKPGQVNTCYEKRIAKALQEESPTQRLVKKTDLILLAAGDSNRYGDENKLLIPIGGKPMFQHSIDTLLVVKNEMPDHIGNIIVVSKYIEIEEYVKNKSEVTYRINHHSELGISQSIQIGMLECEKDHNILFFVCDQPNMGPETICRLIMEFEKSQKKAGILLDEYKNMGNPCIFAPSLRQELEKLKGDTGGKKVIKGLPYEECCFVKASAAQLIDVDYKIMKGGRHVSN